MYHDFWLLLFYWSVFSTTILTAKKNKEAISLEIICKIFCKVSVNPVKSCSWPGVVAAVGECGISNSHRVRGRRPRLQG